MSELQDFFEQEVEVDEVDEERLLETLAQMGVSLPSRPRRKRRLRLRVEAFLRNLVRYPVRAALFIYGKVAWYLWGRRRFLKNIERQKKRWRELAGIREEKPKSQEIETHPRGCYFGPTGYDLHQEAMNKFGEPPVVTDRVAVDYKIVLGDPYLVDRGGKRIEAAPIPKPKRKRAPSKKKGKGKRGRTHR